MPPTPKPPVVPSDTTLIVIRHVRARVKEFLTTDLDGQMDEIRGYLFISDLLPTVVNFEQPKSIRKAQRALATIEARLDRIVSLHHDAKRVLQIISSVEYQTLSTLSRDRVLPEKATGPAQQQKINQLLPKLVTAKVRWQTLDQICTQAQQRLAAAKESIKLQLKLDDNLRWAQERSPG
jgi:hypothetical protein